MSINPDDIYNWELWKIPNSDVHAGDTSQKSDPHRPAPKYKCIKKGTFCTGISYTARCPMVSYQQ